MGFGVEDAEIKRQYAAQVSDQYGVNRIIGAPTPLNATVNHRIAELAKQVTEAGHQLEEARGRYREAVHHKERCEKAFAGISQELMQAIQEHREGTPEGVPYP